MRMKIPNDRPVFSNEMAAYWFEDGVLVAYSKSVLRTVDLIRSNVEFVKNIAGNKPAPLLIYLASSPVPDKETRGYSVEKLPEIYKAMAMIAKPGLLKFIMNILFAVKPSPIPMKSFSDPVKANHWLQQFL